MKSTLKAPGTKRLKQLYDELLSSFAFNFYFRHYNQDEQALRRRGALHLRLLPGRV